MKNRKVRVIIAGTKNRRRRFVPLATLFLAAVSIGFLFYLAMYLYETISTLEIRSAIDILPPKLKRVKVWQTNYEFLKPLKEQTFNRSEAYNEQKSGWLSPPLWKEPTLLNLNFSWVKNDENICRINSTSHPGLKVMPILIHTARSHFSERQVIRDSWGSLSIYKNWTTRLVFLLGEADRLNPNMTLIDLNVQEIELNQEQNNYGDLVIGSFTDSYKNLTYKHLMGYKWILNFCRNAEFVLKVDDDMFVDVRRFIDWRITELEMEAENASDLYCYIFAGDPHKPIREKESKWYVPEEQWPDEYYPAYCSGWTYGINVKLMELIYSVSNRINFFWIDDMFVTGALMEAVRRVYLYEPEIRHLWGKFTMESGDYRKLCEKGAMSRKRSFGAVAVVDREITFQRDMMCMWNKILYDSQN